MVAAALHQQTTGATRDRTAIAHNRSSRPLQWLVFYPVAASHPDCQAALGAYFRETLSRTPDAVKTLYSREREETDTSSICQIETKFIEIRVVIVITYSTNLACPRILKVRNSQSLSTGRL